MLILSWLTTAKERIDMAEREQGNVKWFDGKKGFGFIQRENGSDIFVHFSAIETDGFRTLNDGERVEFSVEDGPKGPTATDVKRVS